MSTIKKWSKYVLAIIICYVVSGIFIFISMNLNYKTINRTGELPANVTIEKAEATNENGRIYGYIQDSELNGQYIKVEISNSNSEIIETQYLKIEGVEAKDKKLFKVFFTIDNAKYYKISIVESEGT